MIPSGTPPARLALLVAERGGRLLVAVRCGRQGPERCPTWVGVFEPSGALVFGLHTTDRLPLLSESAFGVAIDTGGEVELRAWSGEVLARFSLGSWTTAARLLDDGAYMWSDGVALHARDADGHERWQLPDTRVAGALGSDLVASTFYDVRVLDAQSGVMRCRRMAPQGALGPAWADVGVLIPHLCQPLPVGAGRLRGAVRVNGRALAGVRVRAGDQLVVTDRAGWFSADFGAAGRVSVEPDDAQVAPALRGHCIWSSPVMAALPEVAGAVSVLLDLESRPRECRRGCGHDCE